MAGEAKGERSYRKMFNNNIRMSKWLDCKVERYDQKRYAIPCVGLRQKQIPS